MRPGCLTPQHQDVVFHAPSPVWGKHHHLQTVETGTVGNSRAYYFYLFSETEMLKVFLILDDQIWANK